jgi:hypothetical protein
MLQVLDLARENATLKSELQRVHHEVEPLQRLAYGADGPAHTTSDISAALRFWQIISGAEPKEV